MNVRRGPTHADLRLARGLGVSPVAALRRDLHDRATPVRPVGVRQQLRLSESTLVYRSGLAQLNEAPVRIGRDTSSPALALRPVSRDAKCEAGSAWRGVAGEVAVVLLGDAAGDGEAQAVAGLAGIESNEALED